MKKSLFPIYLMLLTLITSCGESAQPDTPGQEQAEKPVRLGIPFGPASIVGLEGNLSFKADPTHYGHVLPDGKINFDSLSAFYDHIHKGKKYKLPLITTVQRLYSKDNVPMPYRIDSCLFQLPDMGKYQVYYSVIERPDSTIGSLLMVDTAYKKVQLVSVYENINQEQSVRLKFFTIQNRSIFMHKGWYYDDGCKLEAMTPLIIAQ